MTTTLSAISSSERYYLDTNLGNGYQFCVLAPGAEAAVSTLKGTEYDTCMGQAFYTDKDGGMHVLVVLTLNEYQCWCMTGDVS